MTIHKTRWQNNIWMCIQIIYKTYRADTEYLMKKQYTEAINLEWLFWLTHTWKKHHRMSMKFARNAERKYNAAAI